MTAKKPRRSLLAAIDEGSPVEEPTSSPAAVPPPVQEVKDKGNTVKTNTYLPQPVHEQLRTLAFHSKTSQNKLLLQGLDLLFAAHALPSIAELMAQAEREG